MGDRANIYVVDQPRGEAHGIYLYTHWNGFEWPERLRTALKAAVSRWNDESYCTRIVISHVYADIHGQESGGGISTFLTDNSYPIIVLDVVNRQVAFAKAGEEKKRSKWYGHQTFEKFVAQTFANYADAPKDES